MSQAKLIDIGVASDNSSESAKYRLQTCAKAGIFRHAVPTQYNGLGNTFVELVKAHDSLGYQTRDPGLILAINAHIWGAVFSLSRFGSEQQKSTLLAALVDGEIISGHAITEPQAGSDVKALSSHFIESNDCYILNGHKRYITNTPIADMMIVYAKLKDTNQLSAFIVKATDDGVEFTASPKVSGCATASMGDIVLSQCTLPKSRLLGKPGAGATMIQLSLERERAFIFSGITGVMQWQLQQMVSHAKNRGSESVKLAEHQAVSHKIANMKLRLDTARLWITHCAKLLDANKRITSESAQTKLYASEAFLQSSLDAVHLFGASGLTDEMTSLVNDAMAGRLMSGSSEIQHNIIAAMLGLSGQRSV